MLKKFFKTNWPIISILALAFVLHLITIFKYGDFWDDEMFSVIYSQKPWNQSLYFWLLETNPPLHMLFLKFWFYIFPITEFFARLPSAIFGTINVWFIYLLGKKLFDKRTALLSALFLSFHSYFLFFSATARTYVLTALLATISFYLFYIIFFEENSAKKYRVYFALTNLLLALSHLTAIPFIFSELLILFLYKKPKIILWSKINLLPFLISGSWIITSFLNKTRLSESWFLNLRFKPFELLLPLINIAFGPAEKITATFLVATAIAMIIFVFHTKQNNQNLNILLTSFLTVCAMAAITGVWQVKFIFICLPIVSLIIVFCLEKIFTRYSVSVILFACLPGLFFLYQILPLTNWANIEQYINNQYQPGKKSVLIYNNYILKTQIDHYLDKNKINKIPLTENTVTNWDDLILRKNYLVLKMNTNQLQQWFENNNLQNYNQIFLIQENSGFRPDLTKLLENNRYNQMAKPSQARISGNYWIYTYAKNN